MIKGRSQGNATVSDITFEDIMLIDVYLGVTIDCVYETQGSVTPNIGVIAQNITFKNIRGTVTNNGKVWRMLLACLPDFQVVNTIQRIWEMVALI